MSMYSIIAVGGLSSPASILGTRVFDPFVLLQIFVNIPSQSVSGIPVLQFNNDNGTTAYSYSVTNGTSALGVVTLAGITGIAGAANGIFIAQINTTGPVVSEILIGNGAAQSHAMMIKGSAGIMDASAPPAIITGSGIWSNTAQITSVQLISSNGGNLGAGTGILVLGLNP